MTSKTDTKVKNQAYVALRSDGESGTSTTRESAALAKDGLSRGSKRKASPERSAPLKKIRVSDPEPRKDIQEDLRIKIFKRNVREGGEGPSETRRGTPDINQGEKESASSSADTGNEDVSKRTGKRKAAADEEQPHAKRRKDLPTKKALINAQRAEFEAKYKQEYQLGKGGYGCVFAGYRKVDNLPVAIKHITKDKTLCKEKGQNGKQLPSEVAVMLKLQAGKTGLSGESAAVSLLDWYDLDRELILVLERPVPCMDLLRYVRNNRGPLDEEKAKIILKQLIDAAVQLEDNCIFHRDIKMENILIETSSDVPRVRLIDFGLSCSFQKQSVYRVFGGTLQHAPLEWHICHSYRPGPTTVWQIGVALFELLHRNCRFDTTRFFRRELTISNELSKNCQDFLQKSLNPCDLMRPTLKELQLHPWLSCTGATPTCSFSSYPLQCNN